MELGFIRVFEKSFDSGRYGRRYVFDDIPDSMHKASLMPVVQIRLFRLGLYENLVVDETDCINLYLSSIFTIDTVVALMTTVEELNRIGYRVKLWKMCMQGNGYECMGSWERV
jgi:hypothetical protein